MSANAGALKTGSPKSMALINIVIGFLDLILIPAEETQLYHFNYAVAEANSVLATLVIAFAAVDYMNKKKGGKSLALPAIVLILSIAMMFFFPQKYSTPYLYQYHIYLIDTEAKSSLFYVSYYKVRDALWGISFGFGLFLLISTLYEIYLVRKSK